MGWVWMAEVARRPRLRRQFREDKFHGDGRLEWHTPDGTMVYEGQYVGDFKHGVGCFKWPDQRTYEGEWKQGQRWGNGTITAASGEKYVCTWKADKVLNTGKADKALHW